MSTTSEETRLLLTRTRSQDCTVAESTAVPQNLPDEPRPTAEDHATTPWPHSVRYLVLLCAFLTSLSFGVTQVPLLYVFRLMTCDAWYEEHGPPAGTRSDRCAIHEIESSTALSVSLLGASTTVFGLVNLFLTGNLIKRIGVKPTLVIQVFFPALRLLVQNVGVEVWGKLGIIIVQCSQIASILGGPSGYLLALNTFITEVVPHEGRTAALGRLTGSMMFGSALGFLLGGILAEAFGIKAPFRLTFLLFLTATVYAIVFLPKIPPSESSTSDTKRGVVKSFFGPLAVFSPKKFRKEDGAVETAYGTFFLGCGVFLGILATGYIPSLLQLYATDVFEFGTKQNGWLIFMYSLLRGVFLTFAFPKLIEVGRKITKNNSPEQQPLLAPDPASSKKEQRFTFDLTYTRLSLAADGLLTLLCTFVHQGWQLYIVAAVLPFAAGTGAASKGAILQMIGSSASSSERTDALAGISLVENMARLSTTFVFGVIFAGFTSIGRAELVFTCNAAIALIGFAVLLFSGFPAEGSRPLDKESTSNPDDS